MAERAEFHEFEAKPFNSQSCNHCDMVPDAAVHLGFGLAAGPNPDRVEPLETPWYEPHDFEPTFDQYLTPPKCLHCGQDEFAQYHKIDPTQPHGFRPKIGEGVGDGCSACNAAYNAPIHLAPDAPHVEQITRTTLSTEVPTDKLRRMVLNAYEMYPGDIGLEGETSQDVETAQRVNDLRDWWLDLQAKQIQMVAGKAVEYGSNSLMELGRELADLAHRKVTDEEAQELGCWINARQKMGRWSDAVKKGKRPSDDTLIDLMVYCVMTLRIRDVGGWPDTQGL